MTKTVFDLDDFKPIDIPPEIAKCPYCDKALYISEIDEWSYADDGTIEPEHFSLECVGEPSMRSRKWKEWVNWHTQMPYVYWLPLEEPVKEWLMANYEFVESGKEREKLERWKKAVNQPGE